MIQNTLWKLPLTSSKVLNNCCTAQNFAFLIFVKKMLLSKSVEKLLIGAKIIRFLSVWLVFIESVHGTMFPHEIFVMTNLQIWNPVLWWKVLYATGKTEFYLNFISSAAANKSSTWFESLFVSRMGDWWLWALPVYTKCKVIPSFEGISDRFDKILEKVKVLWMI